MESSTKELLMKTIFLTKKENAKIVKPANTMQLKY
jgi:hypothetical protein